MLKNIMKKTEEEGSCFKEALATFKNTRNKCGFSSNQLFFLKNWRDQSLPSLPAEPVVEEMMKAFEGVRASRMVKKEEDKRGWKQVRGRPPQTK